MLFQAFSKSVSSTLVQENVNIIRYKLIILRKKILLGKKL